MTLPAVDLPSVSQQKNADYITFALKDRSALKLKRVCRMHIHGKILALRPFLKYHLIPSSWHFTWKISIIFKGLYTSARVVLHHISLMADLFISKRNHATILKCGKTASNISIFQMLNVIHWRRRVIIGWYILILVKIWKNANTKFSVATVSYSQIFCCWQLFSSMLYINILGICYRLLLKRRLYLHWIFYINQTIVAAARII